VQPLSTFPGTPAPAAALAVDWLKPLRKEEEETSLEFFNVLNIVLRYCPTVPGEVELMQRFAKTGMGGGMTFDPGKLSPQIRTAIEQGRANACQMKLLDGGKLTSGEVFVTREFLKTTTCIAG